MTDTEGKRRTGGMQETQRISPAEFISRERERDTKIVLTTFFWLHNAYC